MLAITLFWIVAFGVMIYFMIKEWKGLSRATRAKEPEHSRVAPLDDLRPRRCDVNTAPLP